MKAVVMAGGEGTRLRPLTSNQPKPMVPIVGRPCMEHVIELVRDHGCEDVIVTLAFMPHAIRSYFGDGELLGVSIRYSVEESPAGTAGSVRLAADVLDDTFLVISGDAVCDSDLSAMLAFHHERGAAVTIGLKSVENPLEFGIVVTDAEGRVERFLEKPGWGQVFSDTINTGIYVIEREILDAVPADRPYDFSKELFPLLLQRGVPLYGFVLDGYWQDVGTLDQYRQACFDALDGKVRLRVPGILLRERIWVGTGVALDDLEHVRGPAFIGNYCRIAATARVGPYAVLDRGVTVREHAQVTRSVLDAGSYVGAGSIVEGALVGRSCELGRRARVHEGAAVGDECVLGDESVVLPGVRIYPFKEIEAGTQVDRNVIWESRAQSTPIAHGIASGLVNVDLTPEVALRLGTALGTALERGARVVASRAALRSCRLVKRALISGVTSTGVHVTDLRLAPASLNRHLLGSGEYAAGVHVRTSDGDPEVVEIQVFEASGVQMGATLEKELTKHFARQEFRRATYSEIGGLAYTSRATEMYEQDLLAALDAEAIRRRRFRVFVDYCHAPTALLLPGILGALGVEAISVQADVTERLPASPSALRDAGLARARGLVPAVGADLGAIVDHGGERVAIVGEDGHEIPAELLLLAVVALLALRGGAGTIAVPVTTTHAVERIVAGSRLEVKRTRVSLAALTSAAAQPRVVFAGAADGSFVFPRFLPAPAATSTVAFLLGLLAGEERSLSSLVAALPTPEVTHRRLRCPWALKGTLMRVLAERTKGRETDVTDGLKVMDERGWYQVIPDPAEPVVHVYVEGETPTDAERLELEITGLVEDVLEGDGGVPVPAVADIDPAA